MAARRMCWAEWACEAEEPLWSLTAPGGLQDFMNGVCTNIIHLTSKGKFVYYSGNYDR